MNKERFLDVNGFSTEYDIPLEKRLNKYRKGQFKDATRSSVSETDILQRRAASWRARTRRRQVVIALVAAPVFAVVVALSIYLTYWL